MNEGIAIKTTESVETTLESMVLSYVRFPTAIFGKDPMSIVTAGEDYLYDYDIHEGDTLLVRRQDRADYGQIVCALVDGSLCMRFYTYDAAKDMPYLKSANPKVPDTYNFTIIGTVAWVIRRFDDSNKEVLAS